ncbi:hypothetical protein [Nonlabens ponticola]|uniref:GOLD domain-containing protein n=1 Tax=Nonlabens ponticola TaxID=2496866 RepID=A0A3S9MVI1_9FLAO|nr:hypothetical protein [Nonlabens ponticola]AZQ43221.1 hypothetical protein EJ995_02835 [Nonlabens ponticola]
MRFKFYAALMILAFAVSSCEIGDDDGAIPVQFEVVAITGVDIDDTFEFGETNEITIRYNLPSDCHSFEGFNVQSLLNNREVRVVTGFVDVGDCVRELKPEEQTLEFLAASNGTYNFKFFTGFDENNEPEFLEYEVEVED